MWECQSLLQTSHLCVVSGRMELLHSFLRAGLSASAAISLSSPVLRCCFYSTPPLYAISCKTLPGHSVDVDSIHISYADIFIAQVSAASSPKRISFGMRSSSIRRTCPNHRRLCCLNRVNILGRPTGDWTSALVTLSCQDMPRIRRMLLR